MMALLAAHVTTALIQSPLAQLGPLAQVGPIVAVCPKAPPGAQAPADDLIGYVLWGVRVLFGAGVIISIGAVVAGRVFSMPHASKVGVVGLVVIFLAAIGYVVAPGIVNGVLGTGCV